MPGWVLGFVLLSTVPVAAALDAAGAAMLRDATAQMRQVQTNLKLAQDTAGAGGQSVPVARARLALTRLGSAKDAAAQVKARLEKLPAAEAEVKALQAQFDAAMADINALEMRLTSQAPAATPAAPATPRTPGGGPPARGTSPPPAGGVKLDYRQEAALKDAQFFLREVEGHANAAAEAAKQVEKATDKQALDHRLIAGAMGNISTAEGRVANINTRLASLPAEGAGVAELAAAVKTQEESLRASAAVLTPVHGMFVKALDPANYPEFDADLRRLGELAQMYGNPQLLQSDMPRAAVVVKEAPAAAEEAARTSKKYALLMAQKTDAGVRIGSAAQYFEKQLGAFAAAAAQTREGLPKAIDDDLARVDQLVKQAVDEKKPAFFSGGIPSAMERGKEKLTLYAVRAPAPAKV
jgi:hypothetical protein